LPGLDLCGSLVNHALALQAATPLQTVMALSRLVTAAQLQKQLPAGTPVAPEVAIDGLEADTELALLVQRVGDLLGAPLLLEQFVDPRVLPRVVVWPAATSS